MFLFSLPVSVSIRLLTRPSHALYIVFLLNSYRDSCRRHRRITPKWVMPHNGKLGLLYRNKQWMSDFTFYTTTYKHKQKQTQHIPRTGKCPNTIHIPKRSYVGGNRPITFAPATTITLQPTIPIGPHRCALAKQ